MHMLHIVCMCVLCVYAFKKIHKCRSYHTHSKFIERRRERKNQQSKAKRDDSGICDLISIDWKTGKNSGLARSNQRKRKSSQLSTSDVKCKFDKIVLVLLLLKRESELSLQQTTKNMKKNKKNCVEIRINSSSIKTICYNYSIIFC